MTNEEIIQVARECGATIECETLCVNGKDAHDLLITFTRRIAAMQREIDAGICRNIGFEQRIRPLTTKGAHLCAAAIREQSDD